MFTKEFTLPELEDITVEEVELSSPALFAGANHFGKYCENKNLVSKPMFLLEYFKDFI